MIKNSLASGGNFIGWGEGGLRRRYDMKGKFQMQGGKNWILPKEINANRFFWDPHWLEIGSNHVFPSMGPEGSWLWTPKGFPIF
jgi:hypothetical protein